MPSLFKPIGAVLCLVFALCLVAPNAHADGIISYTITGTFSSNQPTTPLAAGNESFVLEFALPSNPVVSNSGSFGFTVSVPVTYILNGNPIPVSAVFDFYEVTPPCCSLPLDFLLSSGPDQLYILFGDSLGRQLFTGPSSAPTLITGNFQLEPGCCKVNTSQQVLGTSGLVAADISAVSSVEPSSLFLLCTGLIIGGGVARRKRPS
jgi:hypothetical protein